MLLRKFEVNELGLKSPLLAATKFAITDNVIPELQGSNWELEKWLIAKLDLQSAGLHRNTESTMICEITLKLSKRDRNNGDLNHYGRESSMEPEINERDYDTGHPTFANSVVILETYVICYVK